MGDLYNIMRGLLKIYVFGRFFWRQTPVPSHPLTKKMVLLAGAWVVAVWSFVVVGGLRVSRGASTRAPKRTSCFAAPKENGMEGLLELPQNPRV